jgi:hypothetical protein
MAVKNDNFIHIRLEYDEARQTRKDLLASEIDTLNIRKSIERYNAMRHVELDLKAKFFREMKKILKDIKSLEAGFPKVESTKEPETPTQKAVKTVVAKTQKNDELENQLLEIQRKLRNLSY